MLFDQFVNKILKEALVSSIAPSTAPKEKENPKTTLPEPKKLSDVIGQPATQQQQKQTIPTGTPAQQPKADSGESGAAVEDLTKQMEDAAKKDDDRAKKMHDDFAKLIATLTATQKAQQPTSTTPAPAPQTNIPNAQQIIAGLSKM
jgi:excinuclease UvrABC helicase subunit UvrB